MIGFKWIWLNGGSKKKKYENVVIVDIEKDERREEIERFGRVKDVGWGKRVELLNDEEKIGVKRFLRIEGEFEFECWSYVD